MSEEKQSSQFPQENAEDNSSLKKRSSVVTYLTVLFAAAFLLLLMAYFMQQRTNEETIGNLTQSINSIQTLEDVIRENLTLGERFEQMEQKLEEADQALKTEQRKTSWAQSQTLALEEQLSALFLLEKLEYLCQTGQYESARKLDGLGEQFVEILTLLDEANADQYYPNQPTLIQRYELLMETFEKNGG